MSKHYDDKPAWAFCNYCENVEFSCVQQFVKHLREKHGTKEGGSFVCRYGENNVCCSLPVEGVSDADYERHVYKHHTTTTPYSNSMSRKVSSCSSSSDKQHFQDNKWTLYSAAQNLPAVLNDPNKGKQRDFFTKTWGDNFVELNDVPEPNYLPHITIHHFEHYLKKIGKRHKRHLKLNSIVPKPPTHADLLQTFPSLRIGKYPDKSSFDIGVIPKIFLQPNFDLSNLDTFNTVYPHTVPPSSSSSTKLNTGPSAVNSAKLLQEKLTHYLDMVEVQIAQQVAQKSEAFFHAMTSHDVLMEQLGQTISLVKKLREKIQKIDKDLVEDSLSIIKNTRTCNNYHEVYRKLKIMSTVMQTQPTIQLLLSSPDYVGALDLIHTTEDLLRQELAGIHSFRHLGSELTEMLRVIDTLMTEEFERYSTADLNRPLLDSEPLILEGEKLTCIVMGMLRRGHYNFVDMYQREIISAIKAAVKQAVIEVVAGTEQSGDQSLDEQLKTLSVDEWTLLMSNTSRVLLNLLRRVKKGYEIMLRAVDISAGKLTSNRESEDIIVSSETGDWELPSSDYDKVNNKLNALLAHVCKYSQERCAQLLSSRSLLWPDDKAKDENSKTSNISSHWLAEKATVKQLKELASLMNHMTQQCEIICPGVQINCLKSAYTIQATKFMNKFHINSTTKLFLILDGEPWRQTDVPASFQKLVDCIAEKGTFSVPKEFAANKNENEKIKVDSVLYIGQEKFAVVGTVLMLVNIVAEYCVQAEEIPLCAESLLRYLSELLTQFNARCYKLMLGAEAVSEKTGLKKITITNLALLLRALQLILWLIPHVRLHFQGIIGELPRDYLDVVSQGIKEHAQDVHAKLLEIMQNLMSAELKNWDAKPPVPSKSFQNICKHVKKLNEVVINVLPQEQIQKLYIGVHSSFKVTFAEKLQKMNIVNDGGVTHGLVTSELTFYLKDLRTVKALPAEHLELAAMKDIWNAKIQR
ncbi:VPS54 subunit of GARP complex scat [Rhodnius prolixus]|uniref:VPS54 subunit of GARP complex scat n=1 Tax=Rhodnius prolixus TaxID=13249 RepID=UPI003D18D74A